jgi:tetratricopeptide (TPR) repeat protein
MSNLTTISPLDFIARGDTYRAADQNREALLSYEEAFRLSKNAYGENHPTVAESCERASSIFDRVGVLASALTCQERAANIWVKIHGEDHLRVATGYSTIGSMLCRLGRFEEALNYHQRAIKIWLKIHGQQHLDMAAILDCISVDLGCLGRYKEALDYHKQALFVTCNCQRIANADHTNDLNRCMTNCLDSLMRCPSLWKTPVVAEIEQVLIQNLGQDHEVTLRFMQAKNSRVSCVIQ